MMNYLSHISASINSEHPHSAYFSMRTAIKMCNEQIEILEEII